MSVLMMGRADPWNWNGAVYTAFRSTVLMSSASSSSLIWPPVHSIVCMQTRHEHFNFKCNLGLP